MKDPIMILEYSRNEKNDKNIYMHLLYYLPDVLA